MCFPAFPVLLAFGGSYVTSPGQWPGGGMTCVAVYSILALSFLPWLPEIRASTQQAV